MNFGALNAIAINGSQLDAVVRAAITGYCYAISAPTPTYIPEGAFRFRVSGQALAESAPNATVIYRSPGAFEAMADASPTPRLIYRSPSTYEALANATPTPHHYPRYYATRPVYGFAQATASPSLVSFMTSPVVGVCFAKATVTPHFLVRRPTVGVCEAVGYVASDEVILYKWDRPADTRFVVPYVNNRFTVR